TACEPESLPRPGSRGMATDAICPNILSRIEELVHAFVPVRHCRAPYLRPGTAFPRLAGPVPGGRNERENATADRKAGKGRLLAGAAATDQRNGAAPYRRQQNLGCRRPGSAQGARRVLRGDGPDGHQVEEANAE